MKLRWFGGNVAASHIATAFMIVILIVSLISAFYIRNYSQVCRSLVVIDSDRHPYYIWSSNLAESVILI